MSRSTGLALAAEGLRPHAPEVEAAGDAWLRHVMQMARDEAAARAPDADVVVYRCARCPEWHATTVEANREHRKAHNDPPPNQAPVVAAARPRLRPIRHGTTTTQYQRCRRENDGRACDECLTTMRVKWAAEGTARRAPTTRERARHGTDTTYSRCRAAGVMCGPCAAFREHRRALNARNMRARRAVAKMSHPTVPLHRDGRGAAATPGPWRGRNEQHADTC